VAFRNGLRCLPLGVTLHEIGTKVPLVGTIVKGSERMSHASQDPSPEVGPAVSTTKRPKLGLRSAVWLKSGVDAFDVVLGIAETAEELGFDGLFFGDRMLAEVGHDGQGVYNSTHTEIFVTLSALAARTSRIQLGSLVLVVPFRHPVPLAKTIASLDLLSHGRLLLGVGTGWNPTEFEVLGIEKSDAAAILEEDMVLMKKLWEGKPVDFDGKFQTLKGIAVEPTPYRPGGPPIWLGSFSPLQKSIWENRMVPSTIGALHRIGRMADTWIPLLYSTQYRRSIDPGILADSFEHIKDGARAIGRPDGSVTFAFSHWYYVLETEQDEIDARRDLAFFFPGTFEEAKETYLIGTAQEIAAKIEHLCSKIGTPEWIVFTQLGNNPRQLQLLHSTVVPLLGVAD
jgi:probable F420-dependent oxidoreductase